MPQALILEDDQTILMLFQEALAIGGFDTLTALNVPEAIKILDVHTPDVALIDMNMPGRPGTDVLKYIGQTPRLANVKRVVITANALVESRVEELGADLFLVKPVSVKELLTLVRRLVG